MAVLADSGFATWTLLEEEEEEYTIIFCVSLLFCTCVGSYIPQMLFLMVW